MGVDFVTEVLNMVVLGKKRRQKQILMSFPENTVRNEMICTLRHLRCKNTKTLMNLYRIERYVTLKI